MQRFVGPYLSLQMSIWVMHSLRVMSMCVTETFFKNQGDDGKTQSTVVYLYELGFFN